MKAFTTQELADFVHEHMQSKIDHDELGAAGISMANKDTFSHEFELYGMALFEGICNGILMCGGKIEGIEDE